jgi:hypothetical protein
MSGLHLGVACAAVLGFVAAGCKKESGVASDPGGAAFAKGTTNALVETAVQAFAEKDEAGGVIALQQAARNPGMTPEQLMAARQKMRAVVDDLMRRAEAGDAKAKEALAAIERSRSQ